MPRLLEMRNMVKRYGPVIANDRIDLDVEAGQIVGLLGENGSGKSTLMKVLYGMVEPDSGGIVYKGRELSGHSPKSAAALGIGMIHQHFMLVDQMTVAENIMLGWDATGWWLDVDKVSDRIREASKRLGLHLEPEQTIVELSLGQRQRVEILKAIMRGADLLVLDEPTSNLSPAEINSLLDLLRRLKSEGKGVIFISHKLPEVMAVCDNVVVLRDGQVSGKCAVADASQKDLAKLMVERDIGGVLDRVETVEDSPRQPLLEIKNLVLAPHGRAPISFQVRPGELVALTGVDGNGQTELADAIAGLKHTPDSVIWLEGSDISRLSVASRSARGIAYVPADRAKTSVIQSMTIAENLSLRQFRSRLMSHLGFLSYRAIFDRAARLVADYGIRMPKLTATISQLSGGNQQKVVIARELEAGPRVLVACQATWGLDPGATRFVQEQVMAVRNGGGAVVYISSEVEEVLALGDRIGVLQDHTLAGLMDRDQVSMEQIGLWMGGGQGESRELAA